MSHSIHQGETWTDGHGKVHRIDEMPEAYVRNLMHWLQEHAGPFYSEMVRSYFQGPRPTADIAQMAFDESFDRLLDMSPVEYVQESELMRALRRRRGALESEGARV